jgi:hypothetical protein
MSNILRKIAREPLLHFVVLGAVIFVGYNLESKRSDEPGNIVITKEGVASLITGFTRTWQRPPTSEELEGLIRDQVISHQFYLSRSENTCLCNLIPLSFRGVTS